MCTQSLLISISEILIVINIISFILDNEALSETGLKMPTVIDLAKENLQSKLQNLTRVLQPSDNGRYLKCVAYHPAYPSGSAETKRQLDVKCKFFYQT